MHERPLKPGLLVLLMLALCAPLVLVGTTGCVSKGMYRKDVDKTDGRVASVETAVEANESRIVSLEQETDEKIASLDQRSRRAADLGNEAIDRADQAAREAQLAARGKLLWEVALSDDRVKFEFGGEDLPGDAVPLLDDLIGKIKSYGKAVYIEIEGHTDNVGAEEYNQQLGERRAMAVRSYLNRSGSIPLHAMNTISFGESQPVADNSTRDGREKNRRVVVRVLE